MSEDQNTQPVVDETNTLSVTGTEVNDARNNGDDLDSVLKEFDTATKPAADSRPEQSGTEPDLKMLAEQVKGFVSEATALRYRQDMDKTIADIRGDLDPDFADNDFVEAWLDAQARKDPRLAQAWTNRNANPKQFDKVKAELGKALKSKFSKLPDRQATDDRAAVTAAVRGATNRAPEAKPTDFSKLSDNEFQKAKEALFG